MGEKWAFSVKLFFIIGADTQECATWVPGLGVDRVELEFGLRIATLFGACY